jgi:ankyrin repeat protein
LTVSTSPDLEPLLAAGAGVDDAGPDGKTALMFAAMFDRAEIVAARLARGACPDRVDGEGRRALDYATAMGAERAAARLRAAAA